MKCLSEIFLLFLCYFFCKLVKFTMYISYNDYKFGFLLFFGKFEE